MRMTPDTEESIGCAASGCSCKCFKPGRDKFRSCDPCGHGWVVHALETLQARPAPSCGPVEVALPGPVLDLSSLVLYGAQAVPVRLKILLDRLYSVLTPEQVGHILRTLDWSLGDYVRGYMLQSPGGKVLDSWTMATSEEERLILKQFLRFGETRPIVQLMRSDPEPAPESCQSNMASYLERNGGPAATFRTRQESRLLAGVCRFSKSSDGVRHFENFTGGASLLLPFHFPSSALQCLAPPTKDLFSQCLRKPSGTKLDRGHRQEAERQDLILQESKGEPILKIKADPDKPNSALSLWQRNLGLHSDDLHRGVATHFHPSSLHPSISFSSSSSSPPRIHSPSSLHPLPSFSSSFLCPLRTSSFSSFLHPQPSSSSSSLHPLPSSPCSLPSPAAGRKGRVCCGVCGKSFYDKGTLKIHYNAVHLKIKHRCTVAGCTMVFSSLRSRNRHSANPNPRLHTGSIRDAHTHRNAHRKEKVKNTQEDDAHTQVHNQRSYYANSNCSSRHNTPPPADSPPPRSAPNDTASAIAPGRPPIATATCARLFNDIGGNQERRPWESGDSVPKKKPRKSSTPVKIEREQREGQRNKEEEG